MIVWDNIALFHLHHYESQISYFTNWLKKKKSHGPSTKREKKTHTMVYSNAEENTCSNTTSIQIYHSIFNTWAIYKEKLSVKIRPRTWLILREHFFFTWKLSLVVPINKIKKLYIDSDDAVKVRKVKVGFHPKKYSES